MQLSIVCSFSFSPGSEIGNKWIAETESLYHFSPPKERLFDCSKIEGKLREANPTAQTAPTGSVAYLSLTDQYGKIPAMKSHRATGNPRGRPPTVPWVSQFPLTRQDHSAHGSQKSPSSRAISFHFLSFFKFAPCFHRIDLIEYEPNSSKGCIPPVRLSRCGAGASTERLKPLAF